MKILYVGHKPAVPNFDGGAFAMKQLIEVLTDQRSCDAFVLHTHKHPFTAASKTFMDAHFAHWETAFVNTKTSPFGFLGSLLSGKSYILQRFVSEALNKFLSERQYDLIVCDSLFALHAVRKTQLPASTRVWLRNHNVEYRIWETTAQQKNGLSARLYRSQANRLKKAENELNRSVDLNLCLSNDDLNVFEQLVPEQKKVVLPVNVQENHNPLSSNSECCFMGSLNWQPNRDTVDFLLNCWKTRNERHYQLTIGGSYYETLEPEHWPETVRFVGLVTSPPDFLTKHGILVAPVFSGSGIRIKLLEALASGVPSITTALGAQGISDEAGVIIISNEQELFAAIDRLKSDADYRTELGTKGKAYIQKYHSFAVCKAVIDRELHP